VSDVQEALLRRLRAVIRDTPRGFHVYVGSGAVLVTDGLDGEDLTSETAKARATVFAGLAPRWREDDP